VRVIGSADLWPQPFAGRFSQEYLASPRKRVGLEIIDTLGSAMVSLSSVFCKTPKCFQGGRNSGRVQSILIARVDHLGDLILSLPGMKLIRTEFPHARITLLCRSRVAPAMIGSGLVDDIVHLDTPWSTPAGQHSAEASLFPVIQAVRGQGPHFLGIDFKGDIRTIAALRLMGAARVISYPVRGGYFLLNPPVPNPMKCHESMRPFLLAAVASRGLSVLSGTGLPAMPFPDLSHLIGNSVLNGSSAFKSSSAEIDLRQGIVLSVHPGAASPLKNWGGHRFGKTLAVLCKVLLSRGYRVNVRILAGSGEEDLNNASQVSRELNCSAAVQSGLVDGTMSFLNLAGTLNLEGLAQAIRESNLFLCNDSGPMHIAAALGTPLTAIFGPTNPLRFGPVGPAPMAVIAPTRGGGFWEPENGPPNAAQADCWDQKPSEVAEIALNIFERGVARGC
jgi:ADP-heptose:LPS heptosyltransferase